MFEILGVERVRKESLMDALFIFLQHLSVQAIIFITTYVRLRAVGKCRCTGFIVLLDGGATIQVLIVERK
jgi:hypothetical protein